MLKVLMMLVMLMMSSNAMAGDVTIDLDRAHEMELACWMTTYSMQGHGYDIKQFSKASSKEELVNIVGRDFSVIYTLSKISGEIHHDLHGKGGHWCGQFEHLYALLR